MEAESEKSISLKRIQEYIKKSPSAYQEEFEQQWLAFQIQIGLYKSSTQLYNNELNELLMFLTQTCYLYGKGHEFTEIIIKLFENNMDTSKRNVLNSFLKAIKVVDKYGYIDRNYIYNKYLEFLKHDNEYITNHVILQLINSLSSIKLESEIRHWQKKLISSFKDENDIFARKIHYIMICLAIKGSWKTQNIQNAICDGMFHKDPKVAENSARFALGEAKKLNMNAVTINEECKIEQNKENAEMKMVVINKLLLKRISKKSKITKKYKRNKQLLSKELEKLNTDLIAISDLKFEVLNSIYDPFDFTDKLIRRANSSKISFKLRLLLLTVCSRLIKYHKLCVSGFMLNYHKYLKPSQKNITKILSILVECCHNQMPITEMQETIKCIADNFVIDGLQDELITIGINSILQICTANYLAITAELLDDILRVGMETKNTNTKIATASLRNLYRKNASYMLNKKFLDRQSSISLKTEETSTSNDCLKHIDIFVSLIVYMKYKQYTMPNQINKDIYLQKYTLSNAELSVLKQLFIQNYLLCKEGKSIVKELSTNPRYWDQLKDEIFENIKKNDKKNILKQFNKEDFSISIINNFNRTQTAVKENQNNGTFHSDNSNCTILTDDYNVYFKENQSNENNKVNYKNNSNSTISEEQINMENNIYMQPNKIQSLKCSEDSETIEKSPFEIIKTGTDNDSFYDVYSCSNKDSLLVVESYSNNSLTKNDSTDQSVDELYSNEESDDNYSDIESEEVDNENELAIEFISTQDLTGKIKQNKERVKELKKIERVERMRESRKYKHSEFAYNMAGISNKSQSRNKPMAMMRQKWDIREKAKRSAKDKIKSFRNHIKTLKQNKRQKFRRK